MNLAFLYDCRAIGFDPLPVPSSPLSVESLDNPAAVVGTSGQAAREPLVGGARKVLLPSIMAAAGGIPQSDAAPHRNQTQLSTPNTR